MKTTILALTFLLLAATASALVEVQYNFNTQNVQALAFNCLDSSCSSVTKFGGKLQTQTADGKLAITYPSTLENNGYAVYFVSSGFAPKEHRATWHSNNNPKKFTTSFDVVLNKVPECRAAVGNVTVLNAATPNLPLIIETKAGLDALTYSAFSLNNNDVAYVPEELKAEYYSTDIRVTLVVRDSAGNVVDRQVMEFIGSNAIYADESKTARFEFTPRQAGQFTATVTTEVIDSQCSSQQPQSAAAAFTVNQELPRNECYTLLNGLKADVVDVEQSFGGERTFMLENADRNSRVLNFVEQVTNDRRQLALDVNFVGDFVVSGQSHRVTLTSDGLVVLENMPSAQAVRIPVGGSVTFFERASASKRVDFSFSKISNHVSNNPFSQATITSLPTRIEVLMQNSAGTIIGTQNLTVVANPDTANPTSVSLGMITSSNGTHTLIVAGQADSQLCSGLNNSQSMLAIEFYVKAPETFAVAFQVVDSVTGSRVESADVSLGGKTARTTSQGMTVVAGLPRGNYGYTISHPAFNSQAGSVNLVESDQTVLVPLVPKNATSGNPPDNQTNNTGNSTGNNTNSTGNQTSQSSQQSSAAVEEDSIDMELKVESIRIPELVDITDGSSLPVFISIKNTGDRKLENVRLAATIPELGLRRKAGPFDVSVNERESKTLLLEIPDWAEEGDYIVRFEFGNDDTRRIVHRPIEIVSN